MYPHEIMLFISTLLSDKAFTTVMANDMLYSWCETLFTGKITVVNGTRLTDLCVLNKPEPRRFHEVKLIVTFTVLAAFGALVLLSVLLWITLQIRRKRLHRQQRSLLELVDYTALEVSDI